MIKIKLDGTVKRYSHGGELFLEKEVYSLDDKRARYLLTQCDFSTGYPYFKEVTGDAPVATPALMADDQKGAARTERPPSERRQPRRVRPGKAPIGDGGEIKDADGIVQV